MKSIRQWLATNFAIEIKIFTILIMLATVGIMLHDLYIGGALMPNFYHFSSHDWWIWFWLNVAGVIINTTLLINNKCIKCKLLSDLMLQLSGLLILLMGWVFLARYPPLNGFMIAYPLWGVLIVLAGRYMGKRNRELHKLLE